MTATPKPYRIVVGMDFSDTSDLAFLEALDQARRHERPELHFVSVVDDYYGAVVAARRVHHDVGEVADEVRQSLVERVAAGLREHGSKDPDGEALHTVVHVRVGHPADEIVQLASEIDADLIVVGTHGRRGFRRLILGSVAERVLRLAHCPVLVVRPKEHEAADAPEPEPPCPRCVKVREETRCERWWCDEHAEPAARPHGYSYSSALVSALSMRDPTQML